jgi:hypothetical protein
MSARNVRSVIGEPVWPQIVPALTVVVFVLLGIFVLAQSRAATPFISVEPEAGSKTAPAAALADTSASGGQAVKFGSGQTGVPTQLTGWWWANLESVPFGVAMTPKNSSGGTDPNPTAAELKKQWSWFGQPGQESDYGYPEVVSASAKGLPAPPGGDKVLKLHHPLGDTAVHHKLFKSFGAATWPGGAEPRSGGTPSDVSGRYIVYQYVPSAAFNMTSHGWVNMMQFKETIITQAGFNQDPSWWAGVNTFGPYKYTLDLANWGGSHGSIAKKYDFTPYMDKWVKWEFRLYQGDRVEWYLDDKLMDTGLNSETKVGRKCQVGAAYNGSTITECREWVFGAGNYTSSQLLSGPNRNEPDYNYIDTTVYVDLATILPLP